MAKQYLKATSPTNRIWVDNLKDATVEYRPAAETTRKQLEEFTWLEEVPDPLDPRRPSFVICKDDERNASFAAGMKEMAGVAKASERPAPKRTHRPKRRVRGRSHRPKTR